MKMPTKDYFDPVLMRDNSIRWYRRTMEEHNRYIALYGKEPEIKGWTYQPPTGVEVF
jgi:hypothetical protein